MATQVGVITTLLGTASSTSENGAQRSLQLGDDVFHNELISTGLESALEIEFNDGSVMDMGRCMQTVLDAEVFDLAASGFYFGSDDSDVEAIQQALLEGADPSQIGEATAAGAGSGTGGNEGHEPIYIRHESQSVIVTSGFDTTGISIAFDDIEEEIPIPLEEESSEEETVIPIIPNVSIADAEPVTEPNVSDQSGVFSVFLVTLSEPSNVAVTVSFMTADGTAIAGGIAVDEMDYGAQTGSVTFAPGQTEALITVEIFDDYVAEGEESIMVILTDASNAIIVDPQAEGTILDESDPDLQDTTSVDLTATPDFDEDGVTLTYTVTLSNPVSDLSDPVVITFDDLLGNAQTIIISSGTTGTVNVDIAESEFEDVYQEDPVDLLAATNVLATGGGFELLDIPTVGTVQLVDTIDPTSVTLSVADAEPDGINGFLQVISADPEGIDEDTASIVFTATLSNPAQTDAILETTIGDIPIAAGELTGTIIIDIRDSDVYADEFSIIATVTAVNGGNFEAVDLSQASLTVVIPDSPDVTTIELLATPDFDEDGITLTYTATLSNAVRTIDAPLEVNFDDLLGNPQTITITSGTTGTVAIFIAESVYEDVYQEDPVDLLSASNVALSGGGFEVLDTPTVGNVQLVDTIDTVTATLSTTTTEIPETGGDIVYTIILSGGPGSIDPDDPLTFTLSNSDGNGDPITVVIDAGATQGQTTVSYSDSQVTTQTSFDNSINSLLTIGGTEYEDLATAGFTSVDVDYDVTITGLTPDGSDYDLIVDEDDLFGGTDTTPEPTMFEDTFTITSPDGIASLTVGGVIVITNDVFTAQAIPTSFSNTTLSITNFNAVTGEVTYQYMLTGSETQPTAGGENDLTESFLVTLIDHDLDSVNSTLSVQIIDDIPIAVVVADETTALPLSTSDDDLPQDGISFQEADFPFAPLFEGSSNTMVTYGADGAGTTNWTYSLSLTAAATLFDSGINSGGNNVYLYAINDVIYGSTSTTEPNVGDASIVFDISVIATNTDAGTVTLTQYQAIDHGTGADDDVVALQNGLVLLTGAVSVLDADGDEALGFDSIDLGGNIEFNDDGPSVSFADAEVYNVLNDVDTSEALVDIGADTAGATDLNLIGTNLPTGYSLVNTGTNEWTAVSSDGDPDLFLISVDPNTSEYTFTLLSPSVLVDTMIDVDASLLTGESFDQNGDPSTTNVYTVISPQTGDSPYQMTATATENGVAAELSYQNETIGVGGDDVIHESPNSDDKFILTFDNVTGQKSQLTTMSLIIDSFNANHDVFKITVEGFDLNGDPITIEFFSDDPSTTTITPTGINDDLVVFSVDGIGEISTITLDSEVSNIKVVDFSIGLSVEQNVGDYAYDFEASIIDGDGDIASDTFTVDVLAGTAGDDNIVTGNLDDTVSGGEGNDVISTLGGNDILSGGIGNDVLSGGAGDDLFFDGLGDDTLTGGFGMDVFTIQGGSDSIVDFNTTEGDVLDLSELFTIDFNNTIADYLSIGDDGHGHVEVSIMDGNGNATGDSVSLETFDLADLSGATNAALVADLESQINLTVDQA